MKKNSREVSSLKPLQLYLHIPFCLKKCDYCDFLSFPLCEDSQLECSGGEKSQGLLRELYQEQYQEQYYRQYSEQQQEQYQKQYLDTSTNKDIVKEYVDALVNEIKISSEYFRDYIVRTIFMGGGTPSILSAIEIERIFLAIHGNFEVIEDGEITIEANPGTVTEEKIATWKKVGINRVSIGLQSTNNEELKLLGRVHTFEQFLETFALLREKGFDNLNVDLISGIPGQTLESYRETLEKVLELKPEHISAYSLMIEEGTRYEEIYGNEDLKLPDEETERLMYEMTKEILEKRGYQRYEISNYAKKGFEKALSIPEALASGLQGFVGKNPQTLEPQGLAFSRTSSEADCECPLYCRHNLGYWDRVEYLGLGLGAASLIENTRFNQKSDLQEYLEKYLHGESKGLTNNSKCITKDNEFGENRFGGNGFKEDRLKENEFKMNGFRDNGFAGNGFTGNGFIDDGFERIIHLSKKEQMEETMFLGLRKTKGISRSKFYEDFGKDIDEIYGEVLLKMEKESLIEKDDDYIRLTAKGTDVSNYVFTEFIS